MNNSLGNTGIVYCDWELEGSSGSGETGHQQFLLEKLVDSGYTNSVSACSHIEGTRRGRVKFQS